MQAKKCWSWGDLNSWLGKNIRDINHVAIGTLIISATTHMISWPPSAVCPFPRSIVWPVSPWQVWVCGSTRCQHRCPIDHNSLVVLRPSDQNTRELVVSGIALEWRKYAYLLEVDVDERTDTPETNSDKFTKWHSSALGNRWVEVRAWKWNTGELEITRSDLPTGCPHDDMRPKAWTTSTDNNYQPSRQWISQHICKNDDKWRANVHGPNIILFQPAVWISLYVLQIARKVPQAAMGIRTRKGL